jgi:cytosine/uracil/thiamine/allantoin permease
LLGLIVFGYRLSIRGSSGESLASAALTGLASLALWGFFFSFIIFTWRVALRPLPGAEPWSPRNLRRSWHEGFYPALAFLGLLILLVAGISAQAG